MARFQTVSATTQLYISISQVIHKLTCNITVLKIHCPQKTTSIFFLVLVFLITKGVRASSMLLIQY